jgi:hypothetical protein
METCTKCAKPQPSGEFLHSPRSARNRWCAGCRSAYKKEFNQRPDIILKRRAYVKERYKTSEEVRRRKREQDRRYVLKPGVRERRRAVNRAYLKTPAQKAYRKDYFRAWAYGVRPEEYARLMTAQCGLCAICKRSSKQALGVDHDHTTGLVRGLLCRNCNTGIGLLGDNVERLLSSIRYLMGAEKANAEAEAAQNSGRQRSADCTR